MILGYAVVLKDGRFTNWGDPLNKGCDSKILTREEAEAGFRQATIAFGRELHQIVEIRTLEEA